MPRNSRPWAPALTEGNWIHNAESVPGRGGIWQSLGQAVKYLYSAKGHLKAQLSSLHCDLVCYCTRVGEGGGG